MLGVRCDVFIFKLTSSAKSINREVYGSVDCHYDLVIAHPVHKLFLLLFMYFSVVLLAIIFYLINIFLFPPVPIKSLLSPSCSVCNCQALFPASPNAPHAPFGCAVFLRFSAPGNCLGWSNRQIWTVKQALLYLKGNKSSGSHGLRNQYNYAGVKLPTASTLASFSLSL